MTNWTIESIKNLIKETVIYFESTCIESIYIEPTADSITCQTIINFVSGGQYSYDLPFETVLKLVESESIGKAFHRLIRGKFESLRIG